MEPITALFGIACLGAGGGVGYWLKQNHEKMLKLNDFNIVLQESQSAHFMQLNNQVSDLNIQLTNLNNMVDALRATNPELDGALKAYNTIFQLEQLTKNGESIDESHAFIEALSALETLVSPISVENEVGAANILTQTSSNMVMRLIEIFDTHQMNVQTLGLKPVSAHKLGHAAMSLRRYDWAETCFGIAYASSPGNANVLEALEFIAIERGDEVLRRHWLEARMTVSPDNPDLLRSHAHLLAKMGDMEAERDVLRLEALGLDTPADRSLLSGLRARAGSRSEALEAIEQALAEDPNQAKDWLSYASLLHEEGEVGKALDSVNKCLDLDRQNGDAWALSATILATKPNRLKEALKSAIHAVALDAGGCDLVLLKADLLAADGQATAAEESLIKALDKDMMNGELRARIATRYLLDGRPDDAQSLLDATPVGIDHALLHVVEGRLHLVNADKTRDGTGETDATLLSVAISAFEGALKLNRELGVAWLGLARTQRLLRNMDGAEEALTRARRLLPEGDSSAAAEAALLALDQGDITAAASLIDVADIHGDSPVISYVRGNIEARTGHLDRALEYYGKTLKSDTNHIRARLNRCSIYMALDEGRKALDDAEILLDLAPNFTLARFRKAEAEMMLGEWSRAREDLDIVLEKAPHHHQALTQLAACFIALDRPERAETPLNEALRIAPNYAPAWHQRGLLYLEWGRNDNAMSDFEAAVKANPQHLDSRLHIAAMHHEAEQFDAAAPAWREVLQIDPDHIVAKTRLDECETKLTAQ
ncbi:MAG: tetratricopeptide repeat protein [Candidatus Thermoplasmatota archaeon]|nr:tetratricopeptide repeat protein [Candidatus Thermoplasmatota archaeon]